jgi:hypothetical protein
MNFPLQLQAAKRELSTLLGDANLANKVVNRSFRQAANAAVKTMKQKMKSGGERTSKNYKTSPPGQAPFKHANKKYPQRANFYHKQMKAYVKGMTARIGWLGVDRGILTLDKGGTFKTRQQNQRLFPAKSGGGKSNPRIKRDGGGRIEERQYRAIYRKYYGVDPMGTEQNPAIVSRQVKARPMIKPILEFLEKFDWETQFTKNIGSARHWNITRGNKK